MESPAFFMFSHSLIHFPFATYLCTSADKYLNYKIFNLRISFYDSVEIWYHTFWIFYLNVRCWAAEGHGDFLEAGVKGHLPSVADPTEVISGQQVDLGRLHGLLHPFKDLQ